MGEAKRKKQSEHTKTSLTDTHNVFRIDELDDNTVLISNLELEKRGFKEAPKDYSEIEEQLLLMTLGLERPSKQCWVKLNKPIAVNKKVVGTLSHHPNLTNLGLPTLTVERLLD
ncbi:MAG: hypothetical protein KME46_33375 [Brasilonema angustatum HA4187-MV1]|jgi:hypothetical protein|nr:hypothetical protein [Brasilonema angustatum HA4187-MV1]